MEFNIGSRQFVFGFKQPVVKAIKIRLVVKRPDLKSLALEPGQSFFFSTLSLFGRAAENVPRLERDWYWIQGKLYPKAPRNSITQDGGTYDVDFDENYLSLAHFGTNRRSTLQVFHAHRVGDRSILDLNFGETNESDSVGKVEPLVWCRSVFPFGRLTVHEAGVLLDT